MAKELVRLQKFMADNGIASRRKCEELIEQGVVKINGNTAHIGDKVDPKKDKVTVKGRKIAVKDNLVYILLHKPRGYVTTLSDEKGRDNAAQLVADCGKRVYPVGRLDRESEGLLLLTNDGDFANAVTHPSTHIPKLYRVTLRPAMTEEQRLQFEEGIVLDGRRTNYRTDIQDYIIAKVPSARKMIQEAMEEQLLYMSLKGDLSRSTDKEKRELAIDETAKEICARVLPELGISIIYTGDLSRCL